MVGSLIAHSKTRPSILYLASVPSLLAITMFVGVCPLFVFASFAQLITQWKIASLGPFLSFIHSRESKRLIRTCITSFPSTVQMTPQPPFHLNLTKFTLTFKSNRHLIGRSPGTSSWRSGPAQIGWWDRNLLCEVCSLWTRRTRVKAQRSLQHTYRAWGHRVIRLFSNPWECSEVRLAGCGKSWKHTRGKKTQWFQETHPELFIFLVMRALCTFP